MRVGRGFCTKGYYKGFNGEPDSENMDAGRCAALCLAEAQCKFFAVTPGETCLRFHKGAGDCQARNPDGSKTLYRRKEAPVGF